MAENSETNYQLWQKELAFLEELRRKKPELFENPQIISSQTLLKYIGIEAIPTDLGLGYYRFSPQDFVVEEITPDGSLCTVEPEKTNKLPQGEEKRTLYCHLVKVGIYTLEALDRLVKAIGIERNSIGYAGIKDAVAVTSQRISLRKVDYKKAVSLAVPGLFLKNFTYGKGAVSVGELKGNRFTIFIRTEESVEKNRLADKLETMSREGFFNYYGVQRFGSRFSAHVFGRKIMQGDYGGALKSFLIATNESESRYVSQIRLEAEKIFGDWEEMHRQFNSLPYSFRYEIKLLQALEERPDDITGALKNIPEQIRLWVYAYVSYLFNKKISYLYCNHSAIPPDLPLVLSHDRADHEIYREFLEQDTTVNFLSNIRPFFFIRPARRKVAIKVLPLIHAYQITEEGVVISFSLPKASYATTFLSHLFQLTSGLPMPSWVKTKERDILALVNQGSMETVKKILGPYFYSRPAEEESQDLVK
ncbi:MAG: tRNA pseudouridine(13) synthase TruD [Patescibacteria group bacterium]